MMMRLRFFSLCLIFLLLFSLPAFAEDHKSDEDLTVYKDLTLELDVSSSFDVVKQTAGADLSYVHADLLFYPYSTYRQRVLDIDSNRNYDVIDGLSDKGLQFSWLTFEPTYLFGFTTQLETENDVRQVENKVIFPITILPDDAKIYLKETEMIDYKKNGIQGLASRLVSGEDDLYVAVFGLADWVKTNIAYDLNTVTADAALPASWVLDNRNGVCDELTNLFIAMLRSVGVPARFVTGIAYTTSDLFEDNWGPHGWAEVYFPNVGWVPFDVTYGQFGFLDATHIKLKHSLDSDKSSIEYEWTGRDVGVDVSELDIDTRVLSRGELKEHDDVSLDVSLYKEHVSFGSYNLVQVTLKNNEDYYNALTLYIARSDRLDIFDKEERSVLLKPHEEKTLFWIIQVEDGLDRDYVYTFNVRLNIVGRVSKDLSFSADKKGKHYSLQDVDTLVRAKHEEDSKVYSKKIALTCSPEKEIIYLDDEVSVHCVLQNTGNTLQEALSVCLEDECQSVSGLGIGEERQVSFLHTSTSLGDAQMGVIARNNDLVKSSFFSLQVVDKPTVLIGDLVYPKIVESEDEDVTLTFTLSSDSISVPQDLKISVDYGKKTFSGTIDRLEEDFTFDVVFSPENLLFEENEIPISVSYVDHLGEEFSVEETVVIVNPPREFLDSIQHLLNSLLLFLDGFMG
jgi:hypothetical protein